jgi:hypothetical protein
VIVREFRPEGCKSGCRKQHVHGVSDVPQIRDIYRRQEFDYAEPDWSKMVGNVLVDESGNILAYELARKTCETYAGIREGQWATPGVKVEEFRRLDAAVIENLKKEGYQDQAAWIPGKCRAFVRRMLRERFWVRADQQGYVPLVRWFGS